ncbi:hypothetical protein [Actinopolymorpha pittospori]
MSDDDAEETGRGWTVYPGANNPMRAMVDAINQGDTSLATFHLLASIQQTLGHLEWEVKAISNRQSSERGGEYGPEAEPTYDQAQQAAEAGDYPKSIAYGLLNVGLMLHHIMIRQDEMVHLMKRPQ